ncbi:extensin-like domain-containing protein [Histidinibacterium aquaticum]|uniref:Extensin family protein n=1 Tax=Histidinibacterium aquaticum TaxID=2613962 RepID=A0A5J5GJ58_9RHOB|nr:extensin family protein [Histidinibacterium aquaticum]KAA9008279.1 extensin family protein [Histidinibacterium aquaticum]
MRAALALALLVLAGTAGAEAPDRSIRPEARSAADAPPHATVTTSTSQAPWYNVSEIAPGSSLRPEMRDPIDPVTITGGAARAEWYQVEISALAPARTERPTLRPPAILARATALADQRRRGAVCGDPAIQGERVGRVPGNGACGIEGAVRVRSVAGVALSSPATLDCNTARALKSWVESGLKPAVGNEGGGPVEMRVMADYICRGRNGVSTARLSEHSFGRAIDIGGIRLADGSSISVLRGWSTRDDGAQLRQMHRSACGIFGTVLGPDSNAAHRDHFHFDTASYRSGSYCR